MKNNTDQNNKNQTTKQAAATGVIAAKVRSIKLGFDVKGSTPVKITLGTVAAHHARIHAP